MGYRPPRTTKQAVLPDRDTASEVWPARLLARPVDWTETFDRGGSALVVDHSPGHTVLPYSPGSEKHRTMHVALHYPS